MAELPAINTDRVLEDIKKLSSDEFEGRLPGTKGETLAVQYLTDQFKKIGLAPGAAGGFQQPVNLESRTLIPEKLKLALIRNGAEEPLELREDATLSARGSASASTR